MPKLFEYLGIVVLFYSNEHLPIHVHGKYQGRESKAELILEDGRVVDVVIGTVRGRRPLEGDQLQDFEVLVRRLCRRHRAEVGRLLRAPPPCAARGHLAEDQMSVTDTQTLKVVAAEQVAPFRLRLTFGDGVTRVVDFERFLTDSATRSSCAFLDP